MSASEPRADRGSPLPNFARRALALAMLPLAFALPFALDFAPESAAWADAAQAASGTAAPAAVSGSRQGSSYASAEQAVAEFMSAMRSTHPAAVLSVLGPAGQDLLESGDPVADRKFRERVVKAYDDAHSLVLDGADRATLVIGPESWTLPIPLVRQDSGWRFDTAAGVQKILDRRVGRNELNVIQVCREFVAAQREFAALQSGAPARGHAALYAARFESSPGKHDGLYWETKPGEKPSPLGPLMARARAHGYGDSGPGQSASPYHGYYYRILTAQGPHAPGGARNFLTDAGLSGGFALLAFPAKWGDSGIMSFLVNQDGIVFERNLGPDTERIARELQLFDPDTNWHTP
jgi:hypothetical protein